MRFAGLLVMPAGFLLSIAAILLFPASAQRAAFVLCGLAVEAMGLIVAIRGHMQLIRNPQRQDFDSGIRGSANQ